MRDHEHLKRLLDELHALDGWLPPEWVSVAIGDSNMDADSMSVFSCGQMLDSALSAIDSRLHSVDPVEWTVNLIVAKKTSWLSRLFGASQTEVVASHVSPAEAVRMAIVAYR